MNCHIETLNYRYDIVFVEEGATMTAEYYRDGIPEVLIPEMGRLAKRKPYLFMQDGARSHTAKSTLELLHSQRYLELLEPDMWPPNSPGLWRPRFTASTHHKFR